ncbi:MAG TPA: nucleoside hydrolase [Spirochaetia bacterium]|nr:nucleoside hydrolase [Spirochaetia bacterium]
MIHFSQLDEELLSRRLAPPAEKISIVIDTDAFNEIDDQFAISYAALAPNISLEAAYAAPFHNKRSESPADGMERSFAEIGRLAAKLSSIEPSIAFPVLKGSKSFLDGREEPVLSDASDDLVQRALGRPREEPLYVIAIGAPTNIASALLTEPEIRERIVVVWLGGQPYDWHTAWEFNLKQDLAASRILFDSGVPLMHVPCKNVAEHLRVSVPELAHYLHGRNAVSEYLYEIAVRMMNEEHMLSKVIWDAVPVAWMRQRGLVQSYLAPSPILTDQLTWSFDPRRHSVRVAYDIDRDGIVRDLFELIGRVTAAL